MAGFLDTMFGGGAEKEAADKNRALAAQYGTDAQGYLTQGYTTGTGDLTKAIGAYAPLSSLGDQYNKAGSLYLGALGAGGPQGTADAQAAFTNAPGTQAGITAGLDTINRRRAAMGMGNSGNADQDAQTFGQNLQNQQYNTWLQNLQQAGQTGVNVAGTVAGGQAAGYGGLASLAGQYAQNQTGVAGNVLGADTSANTLQAQGEASGAKNLLGAGLSLASLAMGPMTGGMSSLAGMGSSLASSAVGGVMGQPWQAANPGSFGSNYYGPRAP